MTRALVILAFAYRLRRARRLLVAGRTAEATAAMDRLRRDLVL